jgi:hypothetical protein
VRDPELENKKKKRVVMRTLLEVEEGFGCQLAIT